MRRSREDEPFTRNVRRRTEALPRYRVERNYVSGQPHETILRPVYSGGANASPLLTRELIASSLRYQIQQGLRLAGIRGTRNQILQRARGQLIASSIEGSSRFASQSNVVARDIDEQLVENMFSRIVQSNSDMELYQIQWSYVIAPG